MNYLTSNRAVGKEFEGYLRVERCVVRGIVTVVRKKAGEARFRYSRHIRISFLHFMLVDVKGISHASQK
jgi:hypothetical protein